MRSHLLPFGLFVIAAIAVMTLRLTGVHIDPTGAVFIYGFGIVACAFLMGTAAELAQLEVNQSIALLLVAFLAVLPEYAIDVYLVWQAGDDPAYAPLALANMTGSNRLLIGVGWPFLAGLWYLRARKTAIALHFAHRGEVFFLGVATLYSFAIPWKGSLTLVDSVVLFVIFGFYLRFANAQPHSDVELVGPAEVLARTPRTTRRWITLLVFAVAGGGIFASSEPFAEGLIACGRATGIDEYYLIQWLAPFASEAPEFLVAALLVLRSNPDAGFGTLLSSKLNQWTLLVGALPVAFLLSRLAHGHGFGSLPIDARQHGEVLLTAAQSFLGVCVLLNLRFSVTEASWILLLFVAQLFATWTIDQHAGDRLAAWMAREKAIFSAAYIGIGVFYLIRSRAYLKPTVRAALSTAEPSE